MRQQRRFIISAVFTLVFLWLGAWAGYTMAKNSKMTAEKLRAFVESTDLRKLHGAERAKAIQKLANKLNALSAEERRQMRMGNTAGRWFDEMTEKEKESFIEATMPTGFKQMLAAFEQLPEEKRRKTILDVITRLNEAREKNGGGEPGQILERGQIDASVLSKVLEEKVRMVGLKTFYSQSSAETKAALAPVLEELQNVMRAGGTFRGRRRN